MLAYLSMSTEKSGLVLSWSGVQEGQSRECSHPGQEEAWGRGG